MHNSRKIDITFESVFPANTRYGLDDSNIIVLDNKDEFLLPGLIDSHIHASQFPNAGTQIHSWASGWIKFV